jgi:spermidine/putrescine transport system permease protein
MATTAHRRRVLVPYLFLIPGALWLVIFYFIPMAQLASVSLQEGSFQAGYSFAWRWQNYIAAFDTFGEQFVRSFLYAGTATVVALLIAYPLAYGIAFRGGRYRNLLLVLVLMPFLTPFLLRTLAWKIILADSGPVVGVLQWLGVLAPNGRLLATGWAVVAGITYNFLAFMTLPIYVSLEKIDRTLLEAAADLYSNARTAFFKVVLPLSRPGIIAGTLLTLIPASGDFINAQLLGNPQQLMIGNVIDSRFLRVVDYPTAAALSFTLMIAILVLVIPYVRKAGTEELVA